MKKLLAIGMCLMFLGCSETSPKDENGHFVAQRDGDVLAVRLHSGSASIDFRYIVIDKHEYLLMTGIHMGGLTHSPKCQCLKNKMEIVFPSNIVTNEMTQVVPL
jgi:hypothetical protein